MPYFQFISATAYASGPAQRRPPPYAKVSLLRRTFVEPRPFYHPVFKWPAVGYFAVPDGGRPDAGIWHHELRQPGARLAVHDGRILCRLDLQLHGVVSTGRGADRKSTRLNSSN